MSAWQILIHRAVGLLEDRGISRDEWLWGGGTMLMLRYGHRTSRDIDLFLRDIQYLSLLTPRLSAETMGGLQDYSESGNHLRLEFDEGEIDFLVVASVFPDLAPEVMEIPGLEGAVYTMPDKEILGQKLHYRAAGFKGRDLYDFVAVTREQSWLMDDPEFRSVASAKKVALLTSLASEACRLGFEAVQGPALGISFDDARRDFTTWLSSLGPAKDKALQNEGRSQGFPR